MAVRPAQWGFGLNVRVMGREIENRRALENIVADDIPGLMRATAAHHGPLHREQLHYARQLLFHRRFMALMREWIGSFKTLFRFPRPSFFHLVTLRADSVQSLLFHLSFPFMVRQAHHERNQLTTSS